MRDLLERHAKDYHHAAGGGFQGEGLSLQRLWKGEIGEKMICVYCHKEIGCGIREGYQSLRTAQNEEVPIHGHCREEYDKLSKPKTFLDELREWLTAKMKDCKEVTPGIVLDWVNAHADPVAAPKPKQPEIVVCLSCHSAFSLQEFGDLIHQFCPFCGHNRIEKSKPKTFREALRKLIEANQWRPDGHTRVVNVYVLEQWLAGKLPPFPIEPDPLAESKKQEGKRGCVEDVQGIPIILDSIEIAYCGPTGAKVLVNYHSPADPSLAEFKAKWIEEN